MSDATVLIVEDEEGIALLERSFLEDAGYRVEEVRTGAEALERLKKDDIALVVLDYRLPDMNGADVLAALGDRVHDLPILAVTGYADPQLRQRLLDSGALEFILKDGFSFLEKLVSSVNRVLRRTSVLSMVCLPLAAQYWSRVLIVGFSIWMLAFSGPVWAQDDPPTSPAEGTAREELIVGTKVAPPFAFRGSDGSWQGMSIELWESVADELGLQYSWTEAPIEELLSGTEDGSFDLAVAALTVTPERETTIDFSHPFFISGLGIAVPSADQADLFSMLESIANFRLMRALLSLSLVLSIAAFFLWFFERKKNAEQFGGSTADGLGAAFWWSAVTMTTVGYGDKSPTTFGGRLVALIWMFTSVIIISGFTAAIASALTVGSLSRQISGPEDLPRVRVGSVAGTTSAAYLESSGVGYRKYADLEVALQGVVKDEVDAIVYDAPILNWMVQEQFPTDVLVLDGVFERQDYGIAFGHGSPLREQVNRVMLEKIREPWWEDVVQRYGG